MPALMGYARNYIDIPPPAIATGGVLDVARVIESTDPHDLLGAEYLSDACTDGHTWEEFCTLNPAAAKVFDEGPDVVVGDPFAVYAGVECTLQRLDEAAVRARRRLAFTERHQIDLHVRDILDAEAITLGTGTVPVARGIGILESYGATMYGGVPVIVMSRAAVSCLCSTVGIAKDLSGRLTTCQGTPVANISMGLYSDPDGNADPTTWAYVSGQITLLRGPVEVISVPQQPQGDGTYEPPRALAERIYVPLIECLAAKVEVTCS